MGSSDHLPEQDNWPLDPDVPYEPDPEELNELPPCRNSREGVVAERRWIEENFPGSTRKRQRTWTNGAGRQIEEITLVTAMGTEFEVYFDITEWFGKK